MEQLRVNKSSERTVLCRLKSTKLPEPSRIVQMVMVTSMITNVIKVRITFGNKLHFTLNLVMENNTANYDWTRIQLSSHCPSLKWLRNMRLYNMTLTYVMLDRLYLFIKLQC